MLQVSLLGQFEVLQDGERRAIPTRNAQVLFAYLLLHAGRALRREHLAGILWPDSSEENARSNLRHELWRLRKNLARKDANGAAGYDYILSDDLTISFDAETNYTLDVHILERGPPDSDDAEGLMLALSVYRGPLLPGFYQDWVLVERERLQGLFEMRMARLLALLEVAERWDETIEWAQQWIALGETWSEAAYRALMVAHAHSGDLPRAMLAYERLAQGLQRDLGLQPSAQTRALLVHLQAASSMPPPAVPQAADVSGKELKAVVETVAPHKPHANLPRPLTVFVGREKEIGRVRRLVERTRLTTITGAGGVGKTRLAIAVAETFVGRFRDGACWVELASLAPGDQHVAQAIARTLRAPEIPDLSLMESLASYLQDRELLLVLDNCEHLVDACAVVVERLLGDCLQITVLTTSREPLGVPGEKAWQLLPLSLPLTNKVQAVQAPTVQPYETMSEIDSEAVRLFVARAASAVRGYQPADADAAAIAQICLRLDGIPLAIELAAARMTLLSAREIAARLDSRFSLLTSGQRTALPRHQTLQAAIEWSHDLLSATEQCLFRRLSVFAGIFTLEAAEVVCASPETGEEPDESAAIDSEDVLTLLGRLADKSLLQVIPSQQDSLLATRYRFLDTVCSFARIKLQEAGERASLRARHAAYYVRLVEEAEPRLLSAEQARWYRLLQAEADNIRAVVDWATEGPILEEDVSAAVGRAESGLRISGALLWFWWSHSSTHEGLQMAEKTLAAPPQESLQLHRARALNSAAFLLWVLGELPQARRRVAEALDILQETPDDAVLAWSLQFLGLISASEGRYEEAGIAMQEGLTIARRIDDLTKSSFSLAFLGDVAWQQGDEERAQRVYKECAALLGELGNRLFTAYPLRRLGYLALAHSDIHGAWNYFRESLTLNQEGGDRRGVLACVTAMAALALQMGALTRAARLLGVVENGLATLTLNLLSLDQIELRYVRDTLRGTLDPQTFESSYAEGWALDDVRGTGFVEEMVWG